MRFSQTLHDFYEHIKVPWRNSESDAPKDAPRSLSQTPFVKEMVTEKTPTLGGDSDGGDGGGDDGDGGGRIFQHLPPPPHHAQG